MLVKVIAAGVNPADWQNLKKNGAPSYAENGKLAITILGIDGTGIVEAVGSAVGNVKPGDGVWYNDGGYSHFWGSYAQYKLVDSALLSSRPKNVCRSSNRRSDIVVIDRVVTFDGVGEAHRALEAGETLGIMAP